MQRRLGTGLSHEVKPFLTACDGCSLNWMVWGSDYKFKTSLNLKVHDCVRLGGLLQHLSSFLLCIG